jgi:hypothetical protein
MLLDSLLNVTGQPVEWYWTAPYQRLSFTPTPLTHIHYWLANYSGHLLTTVTVRMYYYSFIHVGCFGLLYP